MKKFSKITFVLVVLLTFGVVAHAQPLPPGGPGNTTSVPLDPAALSLLLGAAAIRLKGLPVWKKIMG
ncbi:MAG: hypothetical protein U0V74_15840 [Chitinophagales bacterium]